MYNALTDNPRNRIGMVDRTAQRLGPGRDAGVDRRVRAEVDFLRAENRLLRDENRRLERALDDYAFEAALAARPAYTRELTAGTSQSPLRPPA
jgi:hypothetical protein